MENRKEFTFPSADGRTAIHAVEWHPAGEPAGILQIAHGVAEYALRYEPFARFLNAHGFLVVANDHLGHGLSAEKDADTLYFGPRDGWKHVVDDMYALRCRTKEKYPDVPYFLMGHSMGSFLTRTYLIRYPGTVKGAILMGTGQNPDAMLVGGKALASGVNAGAYEMGLKADQFKNTNARFKNVEFVIKADGVLTITQRPLTITAGSAEGIAPVTCDKYTVEGLATGDKVDSVKITGIQSEPGESPNVASDAVIKNAKGEDVTANYKITYVDGVLKAIEVLNKEIHFNYVIGYTDGTIRPNNDISRAEVATIFFRLLTDEAREQYTTTAGNFTDVKAGMWCNRAIATLTNMGIIKGYTDGSFQPNKSITRAELATIIARFAKLDVNTKTFSDINGHWAQKNIELAAGNGWINGYEDGTFRPNNNITRAETFAMINRVLDRQTESVSDLLPTSEMNMWSDNLNENAWYYKDVQEATNYHKCDRVGDSVYEKWTEKVPDIDWASYQI